MNQIHQTPWRGDKEGTLGDAFSSYDLPPQLLKTKAMSAADRGRADAQETPWGPFRCLRRPIPPASVSPRDLQRRKKWGGRGAARLRRRREPECPVKAPSCLLAEPFARPAPREYQGSHKRDMATYHTPWKWNLWPSLPNSSRQPPGPLTPARDSWKERDIGPMPEEDPPPLASILLAPET